MVAKRRTQRRPPPRGPRGPRGKRGERGPQGRSGDGAVSRLAAQMEQVVKELQIQLTRIAQIQAQLDHLAMGSPSNTERVAKTTN